MSLSHIIDKDKLNSFAQQAIPPIKTTISQLGTALGALSDEVDGIENGLGTAASKDVPSSGDASATEVVMGNDSRLTDARTPTAHTHDDRYYTESEIDTALSGKMNYTNPVGYGSLSIGRKADTALGSNSHAVGQDVSATATAAHAEGQGTTASAIAAHSEGRQTTASADYSHAEGRNTLASNFCSHAEGRNTVASGTNSHAGGYFTEASGDYSTAIGKANDYQTGDLFEVGNGVVESGTVTSRSNALRVTSTGEVIDGFGNKISDRIPSSAKGTANGVASLDSTGKVPSTQLPSYVDDVVEGYYNTTDGKFYEESIYTTEIVGESGKIYISLDTNIQYRWTSSAFAALGGALTLGETSSTAYRGDRGKTAYDHSQVTSGNPHNVSKSDVGLDNVGNFLAVSTAASQGLSDTEKSNARANIGAGTSNFSGSYDDLTNKPTIPTVNNATLTIQKNGTNVQTFTANQSTNVTANITVPTKTSDLTNDSGFLTSHQTVDSELSSTSTNPVQNKVINNALSGKSDTGHTHNYAGSSSAGGAATSATKLTNTTKIGDTNKPVYFNASGVPVAISYEVNKTVPSDAKFTDTTYSNATTSASGLMSATDKSKLNGIADGATANVGTITGITMNGASKGTNGVVDLGTVITDVSGKANTTEAGYSLGVSGTTVTLKNKAGTTLSTITTQDTNTWRGIQDNLTSDSTTDSLSAKQGKALNTRLTTVETFINNLGVAETTSF